MGLKPLLVGCAAAMLVATVASPGRSEGDGRSDPGAAPVAPADIAGFRSARFGMAEADIVAAIAADFGTEPDRIARAIHPLERTTSLSVTVPDLVSGMGTARVLYILGFESEALIQVNVIWGAPVDPDFDPADVMGAASLLRDYFRDQTHVEGSVIGDVRLGQDMLLLFSGADAGGHQVSLSLAGVAFREDMGSRGPFPQIDTTDRLMLRLSYLADVESPDIFRLDADGF